jgi:uracil-DNA glycosylase
MASQALEDVVAAIRACRICPLPHTPRPVVWVHPAAPILIAGQAPGRRVHESGVPWDDASGDRLRDWMGLDRDAFYRRDHIAVAAMGFCYPGTVNGADLPPRRVCCRC